jgi:hypothetical protein
MALKRNRQIIMRYPQTSAARFPSSGLFDRDLGPVQMLGEIQTVPRLSPLALFSEEV